MKKNNTCPGSRKRVTVDGNEPITVGMDLGDKTSCYCVLNGAGEVTREGKAATTRKGLAQAFGAMRRIRIAIEVGTHSP